MASSADNGSPDTTTTSESLVLVDQAHELLQENNNKTLKQHDLDKVLSLYQKALTMKSSTLGPNHSSVAELHCFMARALIPQRHYTAAMEHFVLAKEIYTSDHQDNTSLDAAIPKLQREMDETLDLMVQAANSAMMHGMELQQATTHNHANTDAALWQFEYAHSLLTSVVCNHHPPKTTTTTTTNNTKEEQTEMQFINSLALVDVCRVVASVHVSLSQYGQALPYLQQAHQVLTSLLGKDDPRTHAMAQDMATARALTFKQQGAREQKMDDNSSSKQDDHSTSNVPLHWFEQDDFELENNDTDTTTTTTVEDKSATNDDASTTTTCMGVSVSWIKRGFWKELQALHQLTTRDTMARVRQVVAENESLAKHDKGPASVMVVYADESTIADVINTLDDYCRTHGLKDSQVHVWMQCFNNTSQQQQLSKQERAKRIQAIGHVLAILTPWTHPLIWTQPSCLSDIHVAQETTGCKLTLVLPPAQTAAVSDALVGVDPSASIELLYQALENLAVVVDNTTEDGDDSSITTKTTRQHRIRQRLQAIFRPWIRGVIKAQVLEHCDPDNRNLNGSISSLNGTNNDENNPQAAASKRPSFALPSGQEVALEVFQLQLCNKMGLIFWHFGEYKTALELLEDALGMTELMYGEEHESTATVYQNIANVCFDMGRYEVARETYHKLLGLMERSKSSSHRTAGICTKLGNLYQIMDMLDKAMEYHQRALTIHIKNHHGSSNNLPSANSYKDMGNVFYSKGDNDAALMEFRKALAIQQSVLGGEERHPALALTHTHIGMVLTTKGDLQGALQEYQTAAMIQEETLGADDLQTGVTYEHITSILLRIEDDLEAALEMCCKAKAVYENALGHYHPTTASTWHTLGAIQNDCDMVEESLQSYQHALEIRELVLGEDHPQTAETLQSIGTLLFEIGDLDEALVKLQKAFEILEPILGIEHPTIKGLADTINEVLEA
ncbi:repeat-containing protein [Seminavis robusta]|uniref:Repeat-containing protein n=1 Tax=Seminavis robusta TaxID=568900 RepID=A0A9N8DEK2_9STRA|nr:repeat-containing protein [Seminavis robusta]|eukprot:Sro85_g045470.1 repeat-containing protein (958) ;mRNA; f:90147-93020